MFTAIYLKANKRDKKYKRLSILTPKVRSDPCVIPFEKYGYAGEEHYNQVDKEDGGEVVE
jgi:hypothetical protein